MGIHEDSPILEFEFKGGMVRAFKKGGGWYVNWNDIRRVFEFNKDYTPRHFKVSGDRAIKVHRKMREITGYHGKYLFFDMDCVIKHFSERKYGKPFVKFLEEIKAGN